MYGDDGSYLYTIWSTDRGSDAAGMTVQSCLDRAVSSKLGAALAAAVKDVTVPGMPGRVMRHGLTRTHENRSISG
jgi:hypothetical protein